MPPVGFEPAIPGSERPQTHALDRATIGIGPCFNIRMSTKLDLHFLPLKINKELQLMVHDSFADFKYETQPTYIIMANK